ncbi:MAG: CaiB/BaiF CoA-transferase family protein [Phenylobacterium sp.]|uniref:CaiB/BaiF CoA transferase family protein n=1 Tax=Phenylobacterium sp. TaxID=1871053 RepID=UPI0027373CDC|nr:CaiB/BaiF CoA-transferase family protein [Phenylobacterium sp.]MDP3173828.1 CaiB/BaiF CoA-transferase family protein [Phenylobacterium sp.]
MADPLPLERFRVLDLTRVRSGPTAVRQFADWGAQVLMVEGKGGRSAVTSDRRGSDFQNLNRNKRSIEIDLKSDAGLEVFYRLVRDADVLFENFRPDVKHRLKIDFDTLHAINPRLVYVSISGFGQDGPYAKRPGLDQIIQGMGGLMSITGLQGQGPVRAGIAVSDSSTGLYAALGAMTALLDREVTGKGRWVRSSLLQGQIAMLDFQAARWLMEGEVAGQTGNDHPTAVPMGLFPSADGVINLAASGQAMFEGFCKVAGAEHLVTDPRFTARERAKHRSEINAEMAKITRTRTSADWIAALNAVGVPCGPVNAIDAVFADPQVMHLGMSQPVNHPALGDINLVGQPIEISGLDPALRTAAPDPGQHSRDVLLELGYSSAEIDQLIADQVV